MTKLLLTAGWDVAPKDPEVIIWSGTDKISRDILLSYKGIEGIICGDEPYTEEVLKALWPELRVISRAGNGWDNIDHDAAARLGISVLRQENAYAGAVADSTMAMILALARRLISLNNSMHNGKWKRERYPGVSLQEVTIGIVGYGSIGKEVYRRARVFGGKVIVHRPLTEDPRSWDLSSLLQVSDFITLHVKLTPETRHMIGVRELALMKPTAYIINTARGGIVDTGALVDALQRKKIAGAALDVFEEEPLPINHVLRTMDNVILTPHNSYWSPRERRTVVNRAILDAKAELNKRGN